MSWSKTTWIRILGRKCWDVWGSGDWSCCCQNYVTSPGNGTVSCKPPPVSHTPRKHDIQTHSESEEASGFIWVQVRTDLCSPGGFRFQCRNQGQLDIIDPEELMMLCRSRTRPSVGLDWRFLTETSIYAIIYVILLLAAVATIYQK